MALALQERHAPTTVFVDDALSTLDQMVSFLAIITSGRCAAVTDPDWPEAVRQRVQSAFSTAAADIDPPQPTALSTLASPRAARVCPKGFGVTTSHGRRACASA